MSGPMIPRRVFLAAGVASAAAPFVARLESVVGASALLRQEAQVWWSDAGIVVPSRVGEHIHLEVEQPDPARIYAGVETFHVRVQTHDLGGEGIGWIRVSDQSTERVRIPVKLGRLIGDTDTWFEVPVDFSEWRTGRTEMRWTANTNRNGEGKRQFQTLACQVKVRAATPSYRSGPFNEARGWYPEHEYANARWLTPLEDIRPGATVKVKIGPGSGGKPTRLAIVALNPRYHDGDPGVEILRKTAAGTYSVVVPPGTSGQRLVAISSDGQLAGVAGVTIQ